MGNYSRLITTRNAECKINWESVAKENVRGSWIIEDNFGKLSTLAHLAEAFSGHKVYGYLDTNMIQALKEVCKNIINCKVGVKPMLYYDYDGFDMAFYLEFNPGTEEIFIGTYDFTKLQNTITMAQNHRNNKRWFKKSDYKVYDDIQKELYSMIPNVTDWKVKKLEYDMRQDSDQLIDAIKSIVGSMK